MLSVEPDVDVVLAVVYIDQGAGLREILQVVEDDLGLVRLDGASGQDGEVLEVLGDGKGDAQVCDLAGCAFLRIDMERRRPPPRTCPIFVFPERSGGKG